MIMANSYKDDKNLYELLKRLLHDLRSPLSGLVMWSQYTASRLPMDEKITIDKIIERIKRSLDATSSKLENKRILTTSLNIHILIQDILMEKKNEYRGHDIDIHYNKPNNYQEINIQGVKDDFSRMLSNLINNAIDACGDCAGIINIELQKANNVITLSISDNGKGMPGDVLQKLRNGDYVTHGKENGQGIGFMQIRNTIASLKGDLDIESEVGSGSKVTIQLKSAN